MIEWNEPQRQKTYLRTCTLSEDSDQPLPRMQSFYKRTMLALIRLAGAQVDLSLRWARMPEKVCFLTLQMVIRQKWNTLSSTFMEEFCPRWIRNYSPLSGSALKMAINVYSSSTFFFNVGVWIRKIMWAVTWKMYLTTYRPCEDLCRLIRVFSVRLK